MAILDFAPASLKRLKNFAMIRDEIAREMAKP